MIPFGRILTLGAGFAAAAACALFPARKPAHSPDFPLPLQIEARLDIDGDILGGLSVSAGKIFLLTKTGTLTAVDPAAKAILWMAKANSAPAAALAAGSDRLVFADRDNGLHCFDPAGKELWTRTVPAKLSGDPVLDSGRIYLTADGTDLLTLSAADGAEVWRFKAGSAIRTAPVFWNRLAVFGTADGTLNYIDAQGRRVATAAAGSSVEGPLLIEQSRLFYGLAGGTFHSLDLASRKPLWAVKTGGLPASAPALDGRKIYVATSNNILFCLDKQNGNLDWWRISQARSPFTPAVGGEQIFAAAAAPVLAVLKKSTGAQAGLFDAGEEVRAAPLIVGANVVIATFSADTGKGGLLFLKGTAPPEPAQKK